MNKRVSKTELIDSIYQSVSEVKLKDVNTIVNSFLKIISVNLAEGNSIEMRGFGSFEVVPSRARFSQDVSRCGDTLKVPSRVKFKPGKNLKNDVKKILQEKKYENS